MKDRLGNDLNIGDLCVCYNNMRTGSSTIRLVQYEGEIVGFTSNQVKVKCVQCSYSEEIGREFTCYPDNIFKINQGLGYENQTLVIDTETLPIVQELRQQLEKVTKERDGAISCIQKTCMHCAFSEKGMPSASCDELIIKALFTSCPRWEYGGLQEVE